MVLPEVEARVHEAGEALAWDAGLRLVDVPVHLPGLGYGGDVEPGAAAACPGRPLARRLQGRLTVEMAFGLDLAGQVFNLGLAAAREAQRTEANERMADVLDEVDFVVCATNPDVAFPAEIAQHPGREPVGGPREQRRSPSRPASWGTPPSRSRPARSTGCRWAWW